VDTDPYPLFKMLHPTAILSLFAALLAERSVVFISSSYYHLGPVIGYLVALLEPFSWPNPIIPVLPMTIRMV
jgi:hypothetical protein